MRRAFTFIEMMVVITVISLMAALVTPNLVALAQSRRQRTLEANVLRLPAEARAEARRAKTKVVLRVEDTELIVEQQPADGGDAVEVKRLALTDELQLEKAYDKGESVDLGSWQWTVYPDGTARATQLEFLEGEVTRTLILPEEGDAYWGKGDTAQPEDERWEAGEREQRA